MTARATVAERARRMLALLPYLKPHARLSLTSLAVAVGASVEDVAADLTSLTYCGVPPFSPSDMVELAIDGDTVEVFMAPPALERRVRLSPEEARALLAALESVGHPAGDALSAKLLDAVSVPLDTEAMVAALRASDAAHVGGIYDTLAEALESAESVEIEYFTGSSGRQSVRTVRPYALANARGAWYLSAWCESSHEVRTFRLDRIRSAQPTGRHYERPAEAVAAVVPAGADLPTAEVRLRPGAPHTEARDWPGTTFRALPDGAFDAVVPYSTLGWVARRVVAGLGLIEALGPPELRSAVCGMARRALQELDEASVDTP